MLSIPAECQKSHKDELLPVAPKFAVMLLSTPEEQRTGFVLNPQRRHRTDRYKSPREAGRTIRLISTQANVKVGETKRKGETVIKYATAHDLRRAFGTRWAPRIMPVDLQKLMRHETIETTMKFYVNQKADDVASRLYSAIGQHGSLHGSDLNECSEPKSENEIHHVND